MFAVKSTYEIQVYFPGSKPKESTVKGSKGRSRFRIGEVLAVAAIAVLTFQLLRSVWLERYRVTTGSMEPLLHGDATDGDMVVVDALAWRMGAKPRRFDLGVFAVPRAATGGDAGPETAPQLLKRIIAFGGEWLQTRGGDLWIGDAPQNLARVVKDPLAMRDLRVPWSRWPREEGAPFDLSAAGGDLGGLEPVVTSVAGSQHARWLPVASSFEAVETALRNAPGSHALGGDGPLRPLGFVWTENEVDTRFLGRGGLQGRAQGAAVHDIGLDIRFTPAFSEAGRNGGIVCVHECHEQLCTLRYGVDGVAVLTTPQGGVTRAQGPHLVQGQEARLEFGYLDGRFFLLVYGTAVLQVEQALAAPRPGGPPGDRGPRGLDQPRNRLLFAWAGTESASLHEVVVFRDLFYYEDAVPFTLPAPVVVPDGHYWLFGDNSTNSRDSRTRGGFPSASLVGKPRAILGPGMKLRWLSR